MSTQALARAKTGIAGLDEILHGGLKPARLYLVDGNPGAGKTTLALQFLQEGASAGERCLYVTLSETAEELKAGASSMTCSTYHAFPAARWFCNVPALTCGRSPNWPLKQVSLSLPPDNTTSRPICRTDRCGSTVMRRDCLRSIGRLTARRAVSVLDCRSCAA